MKTGRIAAITVVLAVLPVIALLLRAATTETVGSAQGLPPAQEVWATDQPAGMIAEAARFRTGLENLPASLHGSEVDGELLVDERGQLVPTEGTRRLFEWFLSALGEEPLDVIIARLHAWFDDQLPPAAAAEARALLAGYLDYKRALMALDAPIGEYDDIDPEAVRARITAARALRSRYLDAVAADAFYADDDAFDQYSLERLEILRDASLTPVQQASRLAGLEEQLPPTLAESLRTLNQYRNIRQLTEDWQQRGGSAAELRVLRETLVGAAAADRLEALDAERADWEARLQDWMHERDAILASASLAHEDRERLVDNLRAQRFSATERMRVETLEQLHDKNRG